MNNAKNAEGAQGASNAKGAKDTQGARNAKGAKRTYLEMAKHSELRPSLSTNQSLHFEQLTSCDPGLYRHLYGEVGRNYLWIDRLPWSDDEIAAHLANPDVSLHVLYEDERIAGYVELKREEDGAVEIAYFGLMPHAIGRGLGKHLLTLAVDQAWRAGASRVWLHTSTLDHPHALANYLARGFHIMKVEEYEPPLSSDSRPVAASSASDEA